MKKIGLVIGLSFCLMACSKHFMNDGEASYLQSRNGEGVVVPAPLTSVEISHFYDLPLQHQNAQIGVEPPVMRV